MSLQRRSLCRIFRTPFHPTQWHRTRPRYYTSGACDDPQWFRELRLEMLGRELPSLCDNISEGAEIQLANTLSSFLPVDSVPRMASREPIVPLGHHLIYFNPALPTDKLLPDGTDPIHSPGEPYVRRMWAGGSVRINKERYFDTNEGCLRNATYLCAERIKHVQLRGRDDAAKIFVAIERRFAPIRRLVDSMRAVDWAPSKGLGRFLQMQAREDTEWGDALLIEERNLVFMKERTREELDAIKRGEMAAVKYLDPPGQPDFSHTLTPTRHLLFRYSALTFNAHAIHLDRDYSRNVEGHRNLLVHGPLSLTLMLKFITAHLQSLSSGPQVVRSIEYRNLAPLYCDEQMRLCGQLKKTGGNGSIYDVWIEGPTGGMAVKAMVRTAPESNTA